MKQINSVINRIESSLIGTLDGLELDNTDDIVNKSTVIIMVNNLYKLVRELRVEVCKAAENSK